MLLFRKFAMLHSYTNSSVHLTEKSQGSVIIADKNKSHVGKTISLSIYKVVKKKVLDTLVVEEVVRGFSFLSQ